MTQQEYELAKEKIDKYNNLSITKSNLLGLINKLKETQEVNLIEVLCKDYCFDIPNDIKVKVNEFFNQFLTNTINEIDKVLSNEIGGLEVVSDGQ